MENKLNPIYEVGQNGNTPQHALITRVLDVIQQRNFKIVKYSNEITEGMTYEAAELELTSNDPGVKSQVIRVSLSTLN